MAKPVDNCSDARAIITAQWRPGARVRGNYNLPYDTAIATFPNGRYPRNNGHAAIYVGQNSQGIQVYDQWVGKPVALRTKRSDAYFVIQ